VVIYKLTINANDIKSIKSAYKYMTTYFLLTFCNFYSWDNIDYTMLIQRVRKETILIKINLTNYLN